MNAAENKQQVEAPILDIENEAYLGKIGEHNVLVDLVPHLQIKNIDMISKSSKQKNKTFLLKYHLKYIYF